MKKIKKWLNLPLEIQLYAIVRGFKNKIITSITLSFCDSDTTWLSFWDSPHEGLFVSPSNKSHYLTDSAFQNWNTAEPNGDTQENCAATTRNMKGEIKWNDVSCGQVVCPLCDIPKVPVFQIRGNYLKEVYQSLYLTRYFQAYALEQLLTITLAWQPIKQKNTTTFRAFQSQL